MERDSWYRRRAKEHFAMRNHVSRANVVPHPGFFDSSERPDWNKVFEEIQISKNPQENPR